jgi:hypothetical protein
MAGNPGAPSPARVVGPSSRFFELATASAPSQIAKRRIHCAASAYSTTALGTLYILQSINTVTMLVKPSHPPTHHHPRLTKRLTPSEAESHLSAFLSQTTTKPFLHPDALLSSAGITYSAQSGPNGGLALHHLRRIAAGLKGENLVPENADDLAEQFGEPTRGYAGDDTRLDARIAESEKSARKRKRGMDGEEVGAWADASSEAAFGDVAVAGEGEGEWEGKQEYEFRRETLEGAVGERDPAAPATEKRELSGKDKAARKAAKKERNKKEKKAKGTEGRELVAE